jgi:hypothetical protein
MIRERRRQDRRHRALAFIVLDTLFGLLLCVGLYALANVLYDNGRAWQKEVTNRAMDVCLANWIEEDADPEDVVRCVRSIVDTARTLR